MNSFNYVGYSHFLIYLLSHFASIYLIVFHKYNIMLILYSWSIFGLASIGHDALHNAFSKNKFIDNIIGKLTLNMFLVTDDRWIHIHNKLHHVHVNDRVDVMHLKGETFFEEIYNLYYSSLFSGYNSFTITNCLLKIPFIITLYFMPYYSIIVITVLFSIFAAYLTYITHSFPIKVKNINGVTSIDKFTNKQLINSFDILPDSYLLSLICGGLNAHASHHVYPQATRTELLTIYKKIENHKYYRKYSCLDVIKMYYGKTY
jgi:fatty acid desaturase